MNFARLSLKCVPFLEPCATALTNLFLHRSDRYIPRYSVVLFALQVHGWRRVHALEGTDLNELSFNDSTIQRYCCGNTISCATLKQRTYIYIYMYIYTLESNVDFVAQSRFIVSNVLFEDIRLSEYFWRAAGFFLLFVFNENSRQARTFWEGTSYHLAHG